jgi:hypothetical protein
MTHEEIRPRTLRRSSELALVDPLVVIFLVTTPVVGSLIVSEADTNTTTMPPSFTVVITASTVD